MLGRREPVFEGVRNLFAVDEEDEEIGLRISALHHL